jgi:hypothetical protein
LILLLPLVWAGPADDVRTWEGLYDARLVEAADGNAVLALQYYQELLPEDMSRKYPLRPEILYWLGRARFMAGDLDGAVVALREAAMSPDEKKKAEALLAHIEMTRKGVTTLPVRWNFEEGPGSLVRGADAPAAGGLTVRSVGEAERVLAWDTVVRAQEIDRLSFSFSGDQEVREIYFRARAGSFPAEIQVLLHSADGTRFSAPLSIIPTEEWVDIRLPIVLFRTLDPLPGASLTAVRRVEIQDITGYLSSDRGDNTIFLDDFLVQ